jgi:hypothetical protein
MTQDQRMDAIYEELKRVSPYVRRSMLVFQCLPSVENTIDPVTFLPLERSVLWITTAHPFLPIIDHNLHRGAFGPHAIIYQSQLEGIAVRGICADHYNIVADAVWDVFLGDVERYAIYQEDGTRIQHSAADPELHEDSTNEEDASPAPQRYSPPLPVKDEPKEGSPDQEPAAPDEHRAAESIIETASRIGRTRTVQTEAATTPTRVNPLKGKLE